MSKGQTKKEVQAAISNIKNTAARTAAQAEFDKATKGGSPVSADELKRIQDAAAAKGSGSAVQALQQYVRVPDRPGSTGGGDEQPGMGMTEEEAARRAALEIENARTQAQRTDWIAYLTQVFNSYGLGTLAPKITQFIQQGFSPDTVALKLQETPEYQQRFSGNESRRKAGMPVLSPAEYLALESDYRQIMRASGLPSGFYDEPTDFAKFIGVDVSPAELKQRVDIAALSLENADPFYTRQLQQYYNMTSGDMLAYVLDPDRALPLITRQAKAAQFGAEAARQGLTVGLPTAEQFAGLGVTQDEARSGFEQVAAIAPEAQRLGAVFAGQEEAVDQEGVISAVFTGEGSADYRRRLQKLSEMEQSLFSGQSGVGRGSLGGAQTGQF
jgi:hypothetical protein